MVTLKSIFTGTIEPDVYILRPDHAISSASLSEHAQASGFRYFHLDGNRIRTSTDFFQETRHVMKFPDYCGPNWNAVLDCMRDVYLRWESSKGYILFYENFDLFARNESGGFYTSIEVMKEVVESLKNTDTPMYVLLAGDISIVPDLQELEP